MTIERNIPCPECGGSGVATCDARGCSAEATRAWIRVGDPAEPHTLLCERHYAAWSAAIEEAE